MAVEACGTTQLPLSERKIMQKSWSTIELLCSYNCHSATHGRGRRSPQFISLNQRKRQKNCERKYTQIFSWLISPFRVWIIHGLLRARIFFFISLMISRLKVAHFIDRNFSSIILLMNKERWKNQLLLKN